MPDISKLSPEQVSALPQAHRVELCMTDSGDKVAIVLFDEKGEAFALAAMGPVQFAKLGAGMVQAASDVSLMAQTVGRA